MIFSPQTSGRKSISYALRELFNGASGKTTQYGNAPGKLFLEIRHSIDSTTNGTTGWNAEMKVVRTRMLGL